MSRPPLYAVRLERASPGAPVVSAFVPESIRRARWVSATVAWIADATVGSRVISVFTRTKDLLLKLSAQSPSVQEASVTRGYMFAPAAVSFLGLGVSVLNPIQVIPVPVRLIVEGGDFVSILDSDSISAADVAFGGVLLLDVEEGVGLEGGDG